MIDRLTVLGSGTILPALYHGCSGYLLGGDRAPVLIDCGPGILYRLAEAGISPGTLELILISHFHLDHISDLAAVLNARSLLEVPTPLTIVGPAGLHAYFEWLGEQMDPWFNSCNVALLEAKEESQDLLGLHIQTLPTGHTMNSICYRVTDELGRTLFYSGDTDYNEGLLPLARNSELAIFECSMPEDRKIPGHLTPRLAATLAAKAGVQQLLLTHFYREILSCEILKVAKNIYNGPTYLAKDLSSYPISPEG